MATSCLNKIGHLEVDNKSIIGEQSEMMNLNNSILYKSKKKQLLELSNKYKIKEIEIPNKRPLKHDGDSDIDDTDDVNSAYEPSKSEDLHSDDADSSEESKSVELELRDFVIIKLLDQGGFGKVFLVRNELDGTYYAMKRIRKDKLIETRQIESTMNEKRVLLMNKNHFLLGMKYIFENELRLYFMLDFIEGGNLYENMKQVRRFTEEQTKFFAAQLVIALAYLHKNLTIHRDLKPENVMLRKDGYIVLVDFGLSKIMKDYDDLGKTS